MVGRVDFFDKFIFYPCKEDKFTEYEFIRKQIVAIKQEYPQRKAMSRSELRRFFNDEYKQYYPHVSRLICYDLGNLVMSIKDPPPVLKIECGHDIRTRNDLYDDTKKIFSRTGWYPYITGINEVGEGFLLSEKIERALEHHSLDNIRRVGGLGSLGDLTIASLFDSSKMAPEEEIIGNSCVVRTDALDIILDAGIPRRRMRMENLDASGTKLVLVTHPHEDHAQAFREFMQDQDTFIMSGYVTLEFLLRKHGMGDTYRDLLSNNFFERFIPVRFDQCVTFADGTSITAVATEHHPGSVGFILKFWDGKQLFYSGDVNFESRFFRSSTLNELGGRKFDYSIIDGSQLSRKLRDKKIEEETEDILNGIQDSMAAGENNIIVTNSRDYGVQLFLSLYPRLIDKRGLKIFCPVLVDEEIIHQIWTVENWLMRGDRGKANMDRDIVATYGKSFLTRSVKVHPYNGSSMRNFEAMRDLGFNGAIILDEVRLGRDPSYLPDAVAGILRGKKVKVTALTKRGLNETARGRLTDLFGAECIREFQGYRWYLHTPAEALKRIVCDNATLFGKILIFHTTKAMIRDFDAEVRSRGYHGRIEPLPDRLQMVR